MHPKNENVAGSIPIAAIIVPLSVTYLAPVDPALLITECEVTLIVVYLHEQSTYLTCIVVTNTVIQ